MARSSAVRNDPMLTSAATPSVSALANNSNRPRPRRLSRQAMRKTQKELPAKGAKRREKKESEGNVGIGKFGAGKRQTFVFELGMMTEVDQKTQAKACGVQIVQQLRAMCVRQV